MAVKEIIVIRGLAIAAGSTVLVIAGLTGCSSSEKSAGTTSAASVASPAATASAGSASVSAGAGVATVSIDGQSKDIRGEVVCAANGGNFNIAIGQMGTGIAVVLAEDASTVSSVALGNVEGVALAFQDGAPGGNASATKDGKSYTISGTATGVDMANPMQPITKPFEIAVTCP